MSQNLTDLEEGEITDDIIPCESDTPKCKTPPRRYLLTKNISPKVKRKKNKRVPKFSPELLVSKKKKSLKKVSHSCSRHRNHSLKHETFIQKNGISFKHAQKTVKQKIFPSRASSQENYFSKEVASKQYDDVIEKPIDLNSSYDDLLAHCKRRQAKFLDQPYPKEPFDTRIKSENRNPNKIISPDFRIPKIPLPSQFVSEKQNFQVPKIDSIKTLPDSTSKSNEKNLLPTEDEDEEKLRQIALASCLKRNTAPDTNYTSNEKKTLSTVVENQILPMDISNAQERTIVPNLDNYEIIDMDIDEDQPMNDNELIKTYNNNWPLTDDLFVIDTQPTFVPNEEKQEDGFKIRNSFAIEKMSEEIENKDNDFEETLLRAQLILSLNKKVPNKPEECKSQSNSQNKVTVPINSLKYNLKSSKVNVVKPTIVANRNKPKPSVRKTFIVRKNNVHEPPKMVISIGNETSSEDESETEVENKKCPTEASVEALILNARQMSNEESPAGAVSCLSKAQQQEYSQLKKLIAQRESSITQQKTVHSSSDDLKLLEKKLILNLSSLQKDKCSANSLKMEVDKKRSNYVRSQLAYQHLKEQLLAAEKVNKANAQSFNQASLRHQAIQNAVMKRQALINDLQRECTRLGTSVCGNSYIPPAVKFPSVNRTFKTIKRNFLTNKNS